MAFPFLEDNLKSTRRMEALAQGLSDEDLLRLTPDGWTVAALFAHMAFWDRRVLVLTRRWKEKGFDESPIDADAVNDALKPLFLALDPHTAVQLALSAAKATDAELVTLTSEMLERIQAGSTHFRPNRALHRGGHMAQIEAA
ncbi:MAG TPA: DinB family protein, partial [Anaerolineales bacterium]|nr:DinB family protein [Anaerolineales bacterium]